MVLRSVDVRAAERQQLLSARKALLGGAEALAYDATEVMVDHVLLGLDYVRESRSFPRSSLSRGLDEEDRRVRRHHMAVLDVELGLAGPAGVVAGRDGPAGWMTVSDGGAGRPNVLSKTARSWPTVGEPNESTMMIVWPFPSIPSSNSGPSS